jgi:hypothetical protein
MRLFAGWSWLFSNSNEQALSQVGTWRQRDSLPIVKQTIQWSENGSASVLASATLTLGVVGQNQTKAHLLDLSVNGNFYLNITQGGVAKQIPVKGTTKLPARVTMSLGPTVSALSLVSREATATSQAVWCIAEYIDVTNAANFPVV